MTVSPEDIAAARGMVRVSEHRPLRESEAAIIRNVIDGLAGQDDHPHGVPRSWCDVVRPAAASGLTDPQQTPRVPAVMLPTCNCNCHAKYGPGDDDYGRQKAPSLGWEFMTADERALLQAALRDMAAKRARVGRDGVIL